MKFKNLLSIIGILLILAMVSAFLTLPVSATVEAEATALAKIDPILLEKMKTASPDEKISVWIWFDDLEKTSIAEKANDEYDKSLTVIQQDKVMPSDNLATYLSDASDLLFQDSSDMVSNELSQFIEDTLAISTTQKKQYDEYKNTYRQIASEMYVEHNNKTVFVANL